ncbi:MAG: DUF4038 domain-containing protein [Opitutaceae bacterium]|nr:DUF4038 domain-containing protein [Opitutaceae bacterium]
MNFRKFTRWLPLLPAYLLSLAPSFNCLAAADAPSLFPITIAEGGRYFRDRAGSPFFIVGDSPWELYWQLTEDDVQKYIEKRRSQGFNTLLVDVLPYTDWSNHLAATDRQGHKPFLIEGDFGTPNDSYFDGLKSMVRFAETKGMWVWLVAADVGSWGINAPAHGAVEGMWRDQYLQNGPQKLGKFAEYLALKFKDCPNVAWILGGDRDPTGIFWHVDEMAHAFKRISPAQLVSYHAGAVSSGKFFQWEPWFDFNCAYTYRDPYKEVWDDYKRMPVKPVVLSESGYEGENVDGRGGTPLRVRRQAYWAFLAGACGNLYGSAAWTLQPGWQNFLEAPGSIQMGVFAHFVNSLPWTDLKPDMGCSMILDGVQEGTTQVLAARTVSSDLSVLYIPSPRNLVIDMSHFARAPIGKWFDPTDGSITNVSGSPFSNTKEVSIMSPERNHAGDGDFVLILDAR